MSYMVVIMGVKWNVNNLHRSWGGCTLAQHAAVKSDIMNSRGVRTLRKHFKVSSFNHNVFRTELAVLQETYLKKE